MTIIYSLTKLEYFEEQSTLGTAQMAIRNDTDEEIRRLNEEFQQLNEQCHQLDEEIRSSNEHVQQQWDGNESLEALDQLSVIRPFEVLNQLSPKLDQLKQQRCRLEEVQRLIGRLELEGLVGTVLGQMFRIGERLSEHSQYTAFEVHRVGEAKTASEVAGSNQLVARVYGMNGLTPKHKKYKIRSINRSRARTVFKTTRHLCHIIILKIGPLDGIRPLADVETARLHISSQKPKMHSHPDSSMSDSSEARVQVANTDQAIEISAKPNSVPLKEEPELTSKTNCRRESLRLRQRDRPAAKHCQKRYITNCGPVGLASRPQSLSEILEIQESVHGLDYSEFNMLIMLHICL
ncbi:hypothetical protein F5X98DRAFT_380474 [Xylaria grammica]|nr:hypothetical protein F5X98DRAFT_380474 [Xylaria grammica]